MVYKSVKAISHLVTKSISDWIIEALEHKIYKTSKGIFIISAIFKIVTTPVCIISNNLNAECEEKNTRGEPQRQTI